MAATYRYTDPLDAVIDTLTTVAAATFTTYTVPSTGVRRFAAALQLKRGVNARIYSEYGALLAVTTNSGTPPYTYVTGLGRSRLEQEASSSPGK